MADYVRIALRPEEFERLLEILEIVGQGHFDDDPVVLKLRAKALNHQAAQMEKDMETAGLMAFSTPPKRISRINKQRGSE